MVMEFLESLFRRRKNWKKWIELNATKNEITIRPLHVGQEVLIVIGEDLQEEKIKSYLKI